MQVGRETLRIAESRDVNHETKETKTQFEKFMKEASEYDAACE